MRSVTIRLGRHSGTNRWVAIGVNRRLAALEDLKRDFKPDEEGQQLPYLDINVAVLSGDLNGAKQLSAILHLSAVQDNRGDQAVTSPPARDAAMEADSDRRDVWPTSDLGLAVQDVRSWLGAGDLGAISPRRPTSR